MHPSPDPRRRVLVVAPGLDPVGSGRQLEVVVAGLHARGWEAILATTTRGGSVAPLLARSGVPDVRIGGRPRADASAVARLIATARAVRPRVVLAWGRAQTRIAAAALPFLGHARLVCHIAVPPSGLPTAVAIRLAARVIASSTAVATACERIGVVPSRIAIVPPAGTAAAASGLTRAELASRLKLDPTKVWTLCVAPLEAASRLERLLWAIDQLGVVHRGLEHVLIGSGPGKSRLLRRARVQELADRLHLFADGALLPDLLRECRMVWQSGEVACGGAVLDGMAMGVPAIAVAGPTATQLIVDGVTGRIVPADPESEFPRRSLGILEDDALATALGTAARLRVAAEFPPDRTVAGVAAALES